MLMERIETLRNARSPRSLVAVFWRTRYARSVTRDARAVVHLISGQVLRDHSGSLGWLERRVVFAGNGDFAHRVKALGNRAFHGCIFCDRHILSARGNGLGAEINA